ncbi:MAG: ACP S-malonyltransferase [SAR324 cluster bacterium]|uniref:Malonyl CoA-acyl carrier protein transacylase n=1 Tax=SAR324 cluster bacterium TaxID=2024889 RepID=A0A7X9FT97_9DELT|nr:ACP S-malonyltransferase [SAR324 cluster bacterium]
MVETKKVMAMFPGQGSQKVGMGKTLHENFEIAREIFARADAALDLPLTEICFNGPEDKLVQTAITQPAILTVSSIIFQVWKEKQRDSYEVSVALGHSLGEFSALVAAGALKFDDAVMLVHKRGRYMQEAVPIGQGKMVAVLGKEPDEIEAAIQKIETGVVQIANINAPGQIVVSGATTAVNEFVAALGKAKVIELSVSAPFHCSLMEPAAKQLAADLKSLEINRPSFPVLANYSAEYSFDVEVIRKSLELQVCGRVRWVESVRNAINEFNPVAAIEFGEGGVLSGMLKKINPELERVQAIEVLAG